MTTEPTALRQLIQILNRVRQVRDSLPEVAWLFVPAPIRIPLEEAFAFCESYDRARPTGGFPQHTPGFGVDKENTGQ